MFLGERKMLECEDSCFHKQQKRRKKKNEKNEKNHRLILSYIIDGQSTFIQ